MQMHGMAPYSRGRFTAPRRASSRRCCGGFARANMERCQPGQVQVWCQFPEKVAVGFEKTTCTRGGAIGDRPKEGGALQGAGSITVLVWRNALSSGEVLHTHFVYMLPVEILS